MNPKKETSHNQNENEMIASLHTLAGEPTKSDGMTFNSLKTNHCANGSIDDCCDYSVNRFGQCVDSESESIEWPQHRFAIM